MHKPPRLLAIETSSPRLSLAVGNGWETLKDFQGPLQWRHAENLFEGMEHLLKEVRWPVQSLTGVVVSTGPGSFTGIRIGLAAARALGQALSIPVSGVVSLKTIARGVLQPGETACSLIDALRGDVFVGLYKMNPKGVVVPLLKESRMPFNDLLRKLGKFRNLPLILAGDAASLYKERLAKSSTQWRISPVGLAYPQASILLQLGADRLAPSKRSFYQNVIPLYLRQAAAMERRKNEP